jgi:hypothetical protein
MFNLLFVVLLASANVHAMVTDTTRDTFGVYEQCMNLELRKVYTTTKNDVRKFDKRCTEIMQGTATFKGLDLVNQSAVNQRTLKFRAELMEVAM